MTEEEKKAIGQLIWYKQLFNNGYCKDCNELCSSGVSIPSEDLANSIVTLLNLIQRQDRQIDLMAKYIDINDFDINCSSLCVHEDCQEDCIKQYFEGQAKEV